MQSWIGCSGWQYAEWSYKFYPEKWPKSRWFDYYASQFPTVEINYSYYRFPTAQTVKKWYQQAPKNFRYSIKVNRSITHYHRFHKTERITKDFYALTELLEDKLGCVLFQLPPNLHYSTENLDRIISQIDLCKKNVIEFRHISWWREEVYKTLNQAGIAFCTISAPQLPDDIIATADFFYMRFHGKEKWFHGDYGTYELKQWSKKIKQKNYPEVWVYFNNDMDANAPKDASLLTKYMR